MPEPGRKPGGVEVVVHRLANALVHCGADVIVYSLSAAPPDAEYRTRRLFGGSPWLRNNPLGRLIVLPALLNFVRFEPADVLHFHGDDWFFLRRATPTVRTMHGTALFEARTAQTWKRKVEQYCVVYPLERLAARLCRILLAIGTSTARLYGTRRLIDNGVDTGFFHPGPKTGHPQILYVGTWKGRKRGEFLFNAFVREVLPAFPGARLCMACDYCPDHPAVTFLRFPNDQDLAQLYRESWVFAYPSLYEGFGVAYLEAMASGTAILTSPNEGAAHVLNHGEYGTIAPDAEFAAKLKDLLASAEARGHLERAGLERSRQFSWPAIAQRHLEIYRQAVSC